MRYIHTQRVLGTAWEGVMGRHGGDLGCCGHKRLFLGFNWFTSRETCVSFSVVSSHVTGESQMLNVPLLDNESSPNWEWWVGGGEETASEFLFSGCLKASIFLCSHIRCKGYFKTEKAKQKNIGLSRL